MFRTLCFFTFLLVSLSSRRAWIEIPAAGKMYDSESRRSPHGERGLKYRRREGRTVTMLVALLTESVD